MASAVTLVFVDAAALDYAAGGALLLFLALGWRRFGFGTWVPLLLCGVALGLAVRTGVPGATLLHGLDRALFLGALVAIFGLLRSAAAVAPEVARAGAFLTGQPPSRRYAAMNLGGHLFGMLINLGGLVLLLDLAKRATETEAMRALPPWAAALKLRRMTLAVVRGFSTISLWSPLGFGVNVMLVALPGLSYREIGPSGFAGAVLIAVLGWGFDWLGGRRFRGVALPRPPVPPGAGRGAALLAGHVAALGAAVIVLHAVAPLGFQEALIVVVPLYALVWAAAGGRGRTGAVAALRATWDRLGDAAGEVGIFAAAGFLSVVLPAVVPVEALRAAVGDLGLGATALGVGLTLATTGLAMVGVNPIVTASVMGALASELAVPGLTDPVIALALVGGWTAVIGLSPFITTVILASTIVGEPEWRIGLAWNGRFCVTVLALWCGFVAALTW